MNIEDLTEELCTGSKYSHAVFGCFDEPGHYVQEIKGSMKDILKNYAYNEKEYSVLFAEETGGLEFKARVHGEKIPEGFKLKLIFNDRQGDKRPSSHTDYTLLVPESDVQRIIPFVKTNPSVLIKVFQNMFPSYDRSCGKLIIDVANPEIIDYE